MEAALEPIAASPSLVRYVKRSGFTARTACDHFINGVASYLAVMSWMDWYERDQGASVPGGAEILDFAAAPNTAAVNRAHFFAGALVAKDEEFGRVGSLAVVLAAAWSRMWPEADRDDWINGNWALELGWYIASEACGEGYSWGDDHPPHGLHRPALDCEVDYFVRPCEEDS